MESFYSHLKYGKYLEKNDHFNDFFKYKKKISFFSDSLNSIVFSQKEDFLAVGGADKNIYLLDPFNFKRETLPQSHTDSVSCIKIFNEFQLLSSGLDGYLNLFDLKKNICHRTFKSDSIYKIDKDLRSNLIGVSEENQINFYDERSSFKPIFNLQKNKAKMEFRPKSNNNTLFITGSINGDMCLYDLRNIEKPLLIYDTDLLPSGISNCCFNKKGNYILITPYNFCPVLYKFNKNKPKMIFNCKNTQNLSTIRSFSFGGPNDSFVLSSFDDKTLRYWKIKYDEKWKDLFLFKKNQNTKIKEKYFKEDKKPFYSTNVTISHIENKRILENNYYMEFKDFKSIIYSSIMHSKIPRIFCIGIENCIEIISPRFLGKNEKYKINQETIEISEELIFSNNRMM